MDPELEPPTDGWTLPKKRGRSRWAQVGLVSAALWALVGLGLAFLFAQTGHPSQSGFAALWTGLSCS